MSTNRRNNNRRGNSKRFQSTRTEMIRKPVPRISTLNKKIKRIEDSIELKYKDTLFSDTVDNAGEVQILNNLSTGVTSSTRLGDEVMATSIQFRGWMVNAADNVNGPNFVRVILFWDRQPNGGAPTIQADSSSGVPAVLETQVITAANSTVAPYMYSTQERFRILYDKRFTLNSNFAQTTDGAAPDALTEVYPVGIQFKKKIKLNRKVKYLDTNTGTIVDIQTNSLYMALISSESANPPTVTIGYRLYYKDA